MTTKEQVLSLLGEGSDYETAAHVLGIPPGRAYLVATGLPADGSDSLSPEDRRRPGIRFGSVQALVNPPVHPGSKADEAKSWLKRRVQSDPAMRDAGRRRDAAPPPLQLPDEEEEIYDVIDVLGRDHGQVNFLVKELKAIPSFSEGGSEEQAARRQSIVDMITVALAAHEAAEEALFWPAVRDWLGQDGESLAERATSQEQEGKEVLAELEGMEGTDERFDELASKLTDLLRKHVAFEDYVFLQLREKTSKSDRVALGRKVVSTEKRGPTHPHPKAGSSSASQKLAPLVGVSDKVRDAVGGRPAERKGKAPDERADEAG